MTIFQSTIAAFTQVLESNQVDISKEDWVELTQMANDFPDDEEQIARQIENWLEASESRSQLLEAYEELSSPILPKYQGLAGTKSQNPSPSTELLINAIKKNSGLSDSQPTDSSPSYNEINPIQKNSGLSNSQSSKN
ncbi:MAG: hypothetical protein HC836_47050 [Richelia sp. RM2_1_2]|nr:hypothetical protein [Richelia sp. RM2_1_2]